MDSISKERNWPFLVLGTAYRLVYRLPFIGERLVRGASGAIAYAGYLSPFGIRSLTSMESFSRDLERLVRLANLPIDITGYDDEKLDLVVRWCPYGFVSHEHRGVCDAAMDMDRSMFGFLGMKLEIRECVPDGHPDCRVRLHRP